MIESTYPDVIIGTETWKDSCIKTRQIYGDHNIIEYISLGDEN